MHKLLGILLISILCSCSFAIQANEGGGKGKGDGDTASQYVKMDSLIVNLEGRRHYLRADIQLLVNDANVAEKIRANMPALRHSLIMLFSGRNPERISTMEERENLRQSAREEIAKVLTQHKASKGFEDLFFTDFMVQ